jgi:uncharacterized repeat protein (TIGR03803 family)
MWRSILACAVLSLPAAARAATTESILYSFPTNGTFSGGAVPQAGLVRDAAGNLYGTTSQGGAFGCNCGVVYMLSPPVSGSGAWTETLLHTFQGYPTDGGVPLASLTIDGAGNLYGTTLIGGGAQAGTVFKLTRPPAGQATWTETLLYQFSGTTADGQFPFSSLAFDAAGNLYGTSFLGGANDLGVVFELQPPTVGAGQWTLVPLHAFAGGPDGANPVSGLTFDGHGNWFGTTFSDGVTGISGGTLFRLAPAAGVFTETVLHTFTALDSDGGPNNPFDGGLPYGNVLVDAAGNVYGTTLIGGSGQIIPGEASNAGAVFEVSPPQGGGTTWTETLIHSFNGDTGIAGTTDGASPYGGLVQDAAGNLYGTTSQGGTGDQGTVFELMAPAAGATAWTETVLHSFRGYPDGAGPVGTLVIDGAGHLYGATQNGTARSARSNQIGTVFEITP